MSSIVPTGVKMTTRKLRMWHWECVVRNRNKANRQSHKSQRDALNRKADFHIKAVQVLNDCADCLDSTAEQDLADFNNFIRE